MFIAIINFPPVRQGKDAEFREWFAWSNAGFAGTKGFIRRRLLKPVRDGNYSVLLEVESEEAFRSIQNSPFHAEAGGRVKPLLEGSPDPRFYETVPE